MGNPALPVAEFAEGRDVVCEGPGRDGGPIRGAEWLRCGSLCLLPILQEEGELVVPQKIERVPMATASTIKTM
jgi:hypothetical protein